VPYLDRSAEEKKSILQVQQMGKEKLVLSELQH
jgi:hypothetical protein